MKGRVVVTALLVTVSSWALPHHFTSARAESPSAKTPATGPSSSSEFPSPAELMKKLKAEKDAKSKLSKVVFFDLSEPVEEKPADFSLFGDEHLTTHTLVERLRRAKDDKNIKAVLLTIGEPGLNLSQAQEVRDGLLELKKAGKPSFVYADSYETATYTIASGASDACMLEGGEIMIPGVGMETMFYKGLMDKLGVKADYVQIGEYKGADEEYTRTAPSDELKGELSRLTDALYEQIVEGISSSRHISRDTVKETIDETILTGKSAKDRGFIDHLIDQDGLRELITKKLGNDIDLITDYGSVAREPVDFSNPLGLLQALTKKPETQEAAKPAVALIYAEGVIQDGEASGGLLGGGDGIGSDDMRRALRLASRDDNVKAVVIRIDSPGGSALASEVMWQAVRRVAAKKPVIISVGSMAASGGYYLASAGDRIFADNTAIVGSIGVVGGKFVLKDLFEKLGLHTETFSRGRNAGLFSENEPWTDRQRTMVTTWMKQTYDQFTQRVMTTREGKIKDIDAVARGRIFLARQAKELGMVDDIGGIDDALAYAAKRGDLEAGQYDVKVLPAPKTLADYFNGTAAAERDSAAFPIQPRIEIGADSLLKQLSPQLRKSLGRELQMIQLLQERPIMLVAPYTMTVK